MKMPWSGWSDSTGLAKAVVVLSLVLLISLGLCGANFLVVTQWANSAATGPQPIFMVTGFIELFGIIGSLLGFLVVGIIVLIRAIRQIFSPTKGKDE
jgi:hypothetical protein